MGEVAYALPHSQRILSLAVVEGTTARQAVLASGMDRIYPQVNTGADDIGVFGKLVRDDYVLQPGDRIEIYRPLVADPRESRKQRAARKRK
jgi:uncharacterized protein